jgi:hypothetical protein
MDQFLLRFALEDPQPFFDKPVIQIDIRANHIRPSFVGAKVAHTGVLNKRCLCIDDQGHGADAQGAAC